MDFGTLVTALISLPPGHVYYTFTLDQAKFNHQDKLRYYLAALSITRHAHI